MEELNGSKTQLGTIIITVIITAIVFGGGVYLLTNKNKIDDQKTVAIVPTKTVSVTPTAAPTVTKTVQNDVSDWKNYTNSNYGFSFKYPNDWFVTWEKAQGEQLADVVVGSENSVSPMEQSINAFNLDIQVLDSTDKNLDYWTSTMPRSGKMASVTQKADIVVDEIAGIKQFEDTNIQGFEGSPSYIGATYLIKNNKLYLITLMAKNKTVYESKSGLLDQILSTFKFN